VYLQFFWLSSLFLLQDTLPQRLKGEGRRAQSRMHTIAHLNFNLGAPKQVVFLVVKMKTKTAAHQHQTLIMVRFLGTKPCENYNYTLLY
jgi:hypothetical protein